MKQLFSLGLMISALVLLSFQKKEKMNTTLYPAIQQYLQVAEKDFDKIPADRKVELQKIAAHIREKLNTDKKVSLIYICTHNSRRSHMGQLWAMAAATYYNISGVSSYSGGLEVTAFNPNAIKAVEAAGFKVRKTSDTTNAKYDVTYSSAASPVVAFSKKYTDAVNPHSNFIAVMTCSHADESCPLVSGAWYRAATPYEDPKEADGKPNQDQVYNERCKQIATEVLYTFSLVKTPAH